MIMLLFLLWLTTFNFKAAAECANACNGHGVCGAYDMCVCHRNWQANDCSERVCPFGKAFVDTPKGDLDASGTITGAAEEIILNSPAYPYGTTEGFPVMQDSQQKVLDNTAHAYMECSNSGVCNRRTGACECFDGFDGVACQRASCPGFPGDVCSGHGYCSDVFNMAKMDSSNRYRLWDKATTFGCVCDKGYAGGDCTLRLCKNGLDPTYLFDDSATVRYPIYNLAIMTTAPTFDFDNGFAQPAPGQFAVVFYDLNEKGWMTTALTVGASCDEMIAALEGLPRGVIPPRSVACIMDTIAYQDPLDNSTSAFRGQYTGRWVYVANETFSLKNNTVIWNPTFWDAGFTSSYNYKAATDPKLTGYIYRLEFIGNPGAAIPPYIETYLGDGERSSLASPGGKLITKVWSDGRQGESTEHFPFHCKHVKLQIQNVGSYYFLTGFNSTEKLWLQACLGQADLDPGLQKSAADTSYLNWDYGSATNPHIVKLERMATDHTDGGHFVALIFDTSVTGLDKTGTYDGTFRLLHPFHATDFVGNDWFELFTSKGTLQLVSQYADAFFDFASYEVYTANLGYDILGEQYDGDVSCDPNSSSPNKTAYILSCLQKGDMFFLLDPVNTLYNPAFLNLYTVERIYQKPYTIDEGAVLGIWPNTPAKYTPRLPSVRTPNATDVLHYKTYTILTDQATNWAQDMSGLASVMLYKFIPSPEHAYTYVAQCSNRGTCNTYDGICDCYSSYTGEACETQDALAA